MVQRRPCVCCLVDWCQSVTMMMMMMLISLHCIYCAHLGKTLTTEDDLDTEDLKDDERERDVMVGEDGRSNVMSLVLVVNSW